MSMFSSSPEKNYRIIRNFAITCWVAILLAAVCLLAGVGIAIVFFS